MSAGDMFMVVRMDDHGMCFLVKDDLATEQEAVALMVSMPDHHKQSYSVLGYSAETKAAMLFKHGVLT